MNVETSSEITIGLSISDLPRISAGERLLSDFRYSVAQLTHEMVQVVDTASRFAGYPQQGLTMTENEYETWIAVGRPVERLVGTPGNRPTYFVERHANRYTSDGSPKSSNVTPYDGMTQLSHPTVEDQAWASDGSALHPFLKVLLTKTKRGLPTGPGFYWNIGPMEAADPVVVRVVNKKLQVLLVQRGDGGGLALPGGMVERRKEGLSRHKVFVAMESALEAGRREAGEETGITGLADVPAIPILRRVPVADWRMTAQAWPVTSVYLFMPDVETALYMNPSGGDDASVAAWFPVEGNNLWRGAQHGKLFASHASYVKLALHEWQRQAGLVVRYDGVVGVPMAKEHPLGTVVPAIRKSLYNASTF